MNCLPISKKLNIPYTHLKSSLLSTLTTNQNDLIILPAMYTNFDYFSMLLFLILSISATPHELFILPSISSDMILFLCDINVKYWQRIHLEEFNLRFNNSRGINTKTNHQSMNMLTEFDWNFQWAVFLQTLGELMT